MKDGQEARGTRPHGIHIVLGPAFVELDVAAFDPSELSKLLPKCADARLNFRIIFGVGHENSDAPHPFGLLRARRAATQVPRCRGAR
jgi:hypothetical protein